MTKKLLFSIAALFLAAVMCYADDPFRRHRENHFATIVPEGEHIVFIGNSITNMFEWRDGFGNASVLNRGISIDTMAEKLCLSNFYDDKKTKK